MHTVDLTSITFMKNTTLFQRMEKLQPEGENGAITFNLRTMKIPQGINVPPSLYYYGIITIDCLALLKKQNVETPQDISSIKQAVTQFLSGAGLSLSDFKISRIDYCINYYIYDPSIRSLYFSLLNKANDKIHYVNRDCKYSSGSYHQNGSRVLNIYDKTEERKSKHKRIMPWEKDILRVEHQMKTGAIKATKLPRSFDDWMNLDLERKNLQYCSKIIDDGDYWRTDIAEAMINRSSYSDLYKERLKRFIHDIAATDLSTVSSSMNHCTIATYKKKLNDLNINPVTIDINSSVKHLESLIPKKH